MSWYLDFLKLNHLRLAPKPNSEIDATEDIICGTAATYVHEITKYANKRLK